ncbi:hypothetical protein BRD17_09735 [Halobacteriales archaeon SW_7_68_16]|nr:MAG: hypothetical protein BRD17_09735 [Halobacteriales archaeon SW_7_68_16]
MSVAGRRRPLGITVISVLNLLFAGLLFVGGRNAVLVGRATGVTGRVVTGVAVIAAATAILFFTLGLWKFRPWGWTGLVLLYLAGIVYNVTQLPSVVAVVQLPFVVAPLVYLRNERDLFRTDRDDDEPRRAGREGELVRLD